MTRKADFTEEEWDIVLEGPTSAGMIVTTAERGGTFREAISMGKAYAEARKQHGESELLDEIVSAKPEVDRIPGGIRRGAQAARAAEHPRRDRPARAEGDARGGRGVPQVHARPRGARRGRQEGGRRLADERRRAGGDRRDLRGARLLEHLARQGQGDGAGRHASGAFRAPSRRRARHRRLADHGGRDPAAQRAASRISRRQQRRGARRRRADRPRSTRWSGRC